ncbi:MAG: SH3 domain-containing protein [Oscillibacter sp.]|nr:SH3 domain-containing protein [Oscillibacter sp.]MCI9610169.1 SH3 domain-containing protein [Oscillibacter sp.]
MAMKRCPVCGERYSDTYKNCPFCEEEEYWEEEQEPARRPILREGVRSPGGRGGRSAYGIVTPILIVLIVLMALLLVYLLYGDKLFNKDEDPGDGKPGITQPQEPPATPGTTQGNTPAGNPDETDDPKGSGEPSETDTPSADTPGTDTPGTDTPGTDTPGTDTPGTGTMPEGNAGSSGTASGGMSYSSAAALPKGLTLNSTDFTRKVSEGGYKLRVSGGTGTYTWISENPSVASVASDGTVTPVAAGTTNIVVTDGTKRAICIVRVTGSGTSGTTSSGGGTTTTPATPSSGSLKAGRATVINGGNGVRVRSGPGTNYDILATIPNGGSVQVVTSAGNDWYEVTFTAVGGVTTTGYMKGEFLSNS